MIAHRWYLRALGLLLVGGAAALFLWREGWGGSERALVSLGFAGVYLVPAALGFWALLHGIGRWGGPAPAFLYAFLLFGVATFSGEQAPEKERAEAHGEQPEERAQRGKPPLVELVEQVKAVEGRAHVMLGSSTCGVLYRQGEAVETVPVPDERSGLVVRYGLDPLLGEMFRGELRLALVADPGDGEPAELFAEELSVGPETPEARFGWREVVIDLAAEGVSGGELRLEKSARPARPFVGERFDIDPTDLVYWSRPRFFTRRRQGEPNVLLISLDTLRADHVGAYGYDRATTPSIDAFAEEAVLFEQAIAPSPWTTPSHFSILTGTYPYENGSDAPFSDKRRFVTGTPMLSHLLGSQGLHPVAFTGQGSISAAFGFYQGFAVYAEHEFGDDPIDIDRVYASAVRWLEEHADQRFFMFFHTYEPHQPWRDRHFIEEEGIHPEDRQALMIGLYDGDIRRADAYVGKLLAKLEELGIADETLVVITSDHGEELADRKEQFGGEVWGHGHSLFDELVRVPLLIRLPAAERVAKRIPWQVRSVDIAPTVLELLGFEAPPHITGVSLAGAIRGEEEHHLPALSEATTYGPSMRALRWNGMKYIRRVGIGEVFQRRHADLPFWPEEQLYDLSRDPGEQTDLMTQKPAVAERYREELSEYAAEPGAGSAASRGGTLDPQVRESLRALGYVE